MAEKLNVGCPPSEASFLIFEKAAQFEIFSKLKAAPYGFTLIESSNRSVLKVSFLESYIFLTNEI